MIYLKPYGFVVNLNDEFKECGVHARSTNSIIEIYLKPKGFLIKLNDKFEECKVNGRSS